MDSSKKWKISRGNKRKFLMFLSKVQQNYLTSKHQAEADRDLFIKDLFRK